MTMWTESLAREIDNVTSDGNHIETLEIGDIQFRSLFYEDKPGFAVRPNLPHGLTSRLLGLKVRRVESQDYWQILI